MSSTLNQPFIFFAFMYAGMLAGLIYALITFIKRKAKRKWIKITAEAVFFICVFIITMITFAKANYLDLRAYPFLGIAAGFIVYHFGPGMLLFPRQVVTQEKK